MCPTCKCGSALYRRLSGVESHEAIEGFAAELIDRFGPLPQEVRHLLDIVEIKGLCRQAGIEQIDAGPKGAVIAFRNKSFANPEGLIAFIREEGKQVKLQPDHRLIYYANWETPEERLAGARDLLKRLVKIAGRGEAGGLVELRPAAKSARAARGLRRRAGSASPRAAGRGICKARRRRSVRKRCSASSETGSLGFGTTAAKMRSPMTGSDSAKQAASR